MVKRGHGQHAGITKKTLLKTAIKHDGKPAAVARALGITPQTASAHLSKPEIIEKVESARERALAKVGIDRELVYGKIKKNLNVKDARKQTHAIDKSLSLLGDEKISDSASGRPIVIMPIISLDGLPLKFKVGNAQT